MERYVCIHGHFYQPPRENSWLESVELQDSAYPYHDWNERITAECYAPNTASRLLDEQSRIREIVSNYARISFNFGPTLLAWMETNAPEVYQAILEADRKSKEAFSGHGSALAQAYSHMIMPLANRRDKHTQILWGFRDFEHRFGRRPEGMWLPETAVDLETLDIMAELGARFTILAPHQASRVRPEGVETWQDVSGAKIDPTMAYALHLPSGRHIAVFFYDGPISRAVAFEKLLSSGEQFVQKLLGAFSEERARPQLVHIATDGETYGHHHPYGDMALAYALHYIESNAVACLTNYGEYLEKHPPTHEVEILESTSWSCAHGVERWRSNCGCNTGHPGWNQAWRAPLREALDWLRDTLAPKYERKASQLLKDPWAARNDYIEVILNRSPKGIEQFLSRHAARPLNESERTTALKLLELQRHAMLMFTSCGWFFDELSGIETVQVIHYAGRALQLAEEVFEKALESRFLQILDRAKSNIPEHADGRRVYEKFVKPAMGDLIRVGAHYAVSSLFEEYGRRQRVDCYRINLQDQQRLEAGRARLVMGRARVTSEITLESAVLSFGVLHFGDHNLNAGLRKYWGKEAYQTMLQEVAQVFSRADFPEVIRLFDKHFGTHNYTLSSLFRDEQRKVLARVLESTVAEIEADYRSLYKRHYPLIRFLTDLGVSLPKALQTAAEIILNADLLVALRGDSLDAKRIQTCLEEARAWRINLDNLGLGYVLTKSLDGMMARFVSAGCALSLLQKQVAAVALARSVPFEVNLWEVQNLYYDALRNTYPEFQRRAQQGDEGAGEWVSQFTSLGELLSIRVA